MDIGELACFVLMFMYGFMGGWAFCDISSRRARMARELENYRAFKAFRNDPYPKPSEGVHAFNPLNEGDLSPEKLNRAHLERQRDPIRDMTLEDYVEWREAMGRYPGES